MVKVGDGVTQRMGLFSDCYPYTVIKIVSPREIIVQEDKHTPGPGFDYYSNQTYTYSPDPDGRTIVFTLRKTGRFHPIGEPAKAWNALSLGGRRYYQDPSF